MGSVALAIIVLAAAVPTPREDMVEIVRLQRAGRYADAWEKTVALYEHGQRDAVLIRTLQSLGLRLGRYDDLLALLRLNDDRELTFHEELLRAEILIRQGNADKGLRVLESALDDAGPTSSIRAIALLRGRGMVEDALRLAQRQRQSTASGDPTWMALTREIVSLSCEHGSGINCLSNAFALVEADSLSFSWAAEKVARSPELTRGAILDAVPDGPPGRYSRKLAARLLLEIGRPADGLVMISEGQVPTSTLEEYAAACLAREHCEVAAEAYLRLLGSAASRDDTLSAVQGLMTVRSRCGTADEAAAWADRLLKLDPSPDRASGAHHILARAALAAGDPARAAQHAREAHDLALGQTRALPLWIQAEAFLVQGRISEAGSVYAAIARTWPADTLANDCLARITVLGDSCAGIDDFAGGIGLRWAGELEAAAAAFNEAALACPDSRMSCEAYLEASRCLLQQGKLPEAESLLRDMGADSVCTAKSLLWLARVLVAEARSEDAVEELERLLLEFPGSPMVIPARRELSRLRLDQGP